MHTMVVIASSIEWDDIIQTGVESWKADPKNEDLLYGGYIDIYDDGYWSGDSVLIVKAMFESDLRELENYFISELELKTDWTPEDQYPFFFEIV